jgi:hypothetical protein
MTNPFAVNPGGVVQGIGPGPVMGQGIADVLAQMQIGKENQFRQQELQNQMMQQQALQQYYQAQAQAEQQRIAAEAQESLYKREGLRQGGQAVQNYLGTQGQPGVFQPGATTTPQPGENIYRDTLQGGANLIGGAQGLDRALNGVSPENIPDALKSLQDAQALLPQAPAPPKPTDDMQNIAQLAQMMGRPLNDPEVIRTYRTMITPQPGTVVNVGDKVQSAHAVETAKLDAGAEQESYKNAGLAASSIAPMAEAYKLVNRSFTGFGANQLVGLARLAGVAGFKPSGDRAADTQVMMKLMGNNVLAKLQTRALGSNTAVSEGDRKFMERNAGYDITLQPSAIKRIIRIEMGINLEKMITTKLELQKAMTTYDDPDSRRQLQGKIDLIDSKLAQPWNEYWKIYSQEQAEETSGSNIDPNAIRKQILDRARQSGVVR